ncbi:MAG: uracil-DNA glycosylase [Candidatus Scalinduaceae bacterium]
MNASHQTTKLQDIMTETLTLLKIVYDKIDLERKFGINLLRLPHINKLNYSFSKNATSPQISQKSLFNSENSMKMISRIEKIENLEKLEEQVKKCEKCGLCKNRTNVVFGTGNPDADLMFVGEAPGYYEDIKGEPFVGRAGQLLTKIIESIGLKRSDVYIANILKCRPPENRNPTANEIIVCTPHLIKQIEIICPKIICALGTFAAQTLVNTKKTIGSLRGKFHDYQGTKLLATYHPAYLLRNPNEKKKTWEDMKKIRDFLKEM